MTFLLSVEGLLNFMKLAVEASVKNDSKGVILFSAHSFFTNELKSFNLKTLSVKFYSLK